MSPQRGEVWLADLGMAGKIRPVIIISRNDPDPPRKITTYVPVTSVNRGSKYEVELPPLPFLNPGSTANAQGVSSAATAERNRFIRRIGDLPPDVLSEVEQALLFAMGIAN
jgi:mRNA interferase MazF